MTALPAPTLADVCRGYMMIRPPGGFFSHLTAAELHGMPLPPRSEWSATTLIDVSVPAPGRAPRALGLRGHAVRIAPGDVGVLGGIPMATAERAWCDLASDLDVEDLVVAGDWLVRRRGEPTLEHLRTAVAPSVARRGRPALVEAFGLIDPRSESPQESRLRVRLHLGGVRGFQANMPLVTSAGRRYRGDIVFPSERVILEYQGDHHRNRTVYRGDMSRRLDLQADGWTIVELGPADIDDGALVRRIRAILVASGIRDAAASYASGATSALRAASAPGPRR